MSTYLGADDAARILGVTKPTLYAYVSRGLVSRDIAPDGRTSLYEREQVEQLAERSRRAARPEPTIDVAIESSITRIGDDGIQYRGRDALALANRVGFEQVAELLWNGELPDAAVRWAVDLDALTSIAAAADSAGITDGVGRLALAATVLAERRPDDADDVAARYLLALAPSLLGGPARGSIADRLTRTSLGNPSAATVAAVETALVLLADHELATSTLAVRVAASVRATPYAALAAGLHVVSGRLHGAAARQAHAMLVDAADGGADHAIRTASVGGRRLPGFGHSVYKRGDPRFAPLLAATRRADTGRIVVVDELLAEAALRTGHQPNVDMALAALAYVVGLPAELPLFAVARLAGWAAHDAEERGERALRYRGLSRPRRQPDGSPG